ncbi:MAG: ATP synthase F1 subunit gamma [Acidobacteria bacterium]|nr:ATP synthase F1 subunit gamma [Acidobacteriota bacterium]
MPSIQDLRRRVRAVKNMRQITKAMKMVAAARLRRAQERVTTARPYTAKMMQILRDASRRTVDYRDPLLNGHDRDQPARRVIFVVITADKGLCGAFNTNLIKTAQDYLRTNPDTAIELVLVGRKGVDFFRRRPVSVRREYIGITGTGKVDPSAAIDIARDLIGDYLAEEKPVDAVFLLYNEFKSALSQRPVIEQLLPLRQAVPGRFEEPEPLTDYLYEQPATQIFSELLPKLVENQVYHGLLESVASELGARMTAMESASKNASEVIDRLTLNMNRVRQARITREIIEVVSGAEAL